MKATAIKKRENYEVKDGVFGKVVMTAGRRDVWHVQLEFTPRHIFTSNKKYATYESADAAARRLMKTYEVVQAA